MANKTGVPEPEILRRTYRFAVAVSRFVVAQLRKAQFHPGYPHLKQVQRSAASVGANIEEAQGGQSRADFLSKMSIAFKEARESDYWLRMIPDSDASLPMTVQQSSKIEPWLNPKSRHLDNTLDRLAAEAQELRKILGAIVMSTRGSKRQSNHEDSAA